MNKQEITDFLLKIRQLSSPEEKKKSIEQIRANILAETREEAVGRIN